MFKYKLILILISFSLIACKTVKEPVEKETSSFYMDGKTKFLKAKDLTEAIEFAAEKNKILFVEFEADWCLPCKVMSEEVFTDTSTAEFMNKNFINYKLDIEEGSGPNMKFLYQIDILPTLIFMDQNGRTLSRNNGSLMHGGLKELGEKAISQWGSIGLSFNN